MNILAFDISYLNVGWVYLHGKKLVSHDSLKREKEEDSYSFAIRVSESVLHDKRILEDWWAGNQNKLLKILYEVQWGPVPAVRRKPIMKCLTQIGRVLQELGFEGDPMQADKKGKERAAIKTDYTDDDLTEHEGDALAIADRYIRENKC
jgi:hypothetical protein